MTQDELKIIAAQRAVEYIKSNMIVGLGSGSTAKHAIIHIGKRLKSGELVNIQGIPTSVESENLARQAGIPITNFQEVPRVDITIDGADEVDNDLNVIKGGGGALLREKVVAQNTEMQIIVVDETKLSSNLGTNFYLPIEVLNYALPVEKHFLESLGASVAQRKSVGGNFITDEGNIILDCRFGLINNAEALAEKLNARAGIVEHGLFIGLVDKVICAGSEGIREIIK